MTPSNPAIEGAGSGTFRLPEPAARVERYAEKTDESTCAAL